MKTIQDQVLECLARCNHDRKIVLKTLNIQVLERLHRKGDSIAITFKPCLNAMTVSPKQKPSITTLFKRCYVIFLKS